MAGHPADHPGPLVFVDDLASPEVAPDDLHHLQRVLRLRPGAPMTIGDGRGSWQAARLAEVPEPTGPVEVAPVPSPTLTVGFALVKNDKPELVVQKLTELGIDRIQPFRAERSVVRWDEARAAKALARLRLVARSAAAQCHRPWLPEIAGVVELAELLATPAPGLAVADRGGAPVGPEHTTLLVGPEGGWADGEVDGRIARVSLGSHVLRAETAAIVAGALLAGQRG